MSDCPFLAKHNCSSCTFALRARLVRQNAAVLIPDVDLACAGGVQLNKDKTAFQRIFVQDVRKCEDMLRIIRYLQGLYVQVLQATLLVAPLHIMWMVVFGWYCVLSGVQRISSTACRCKVLTGMPVR